MIRPAPRRPARPPRQLAGSSTRRTSDFPAHHLLTPVKEPERWERTTLQVTGIASFTVAALAIREGAEAWRGDLQKGDREQDKPA